MSVPVSVLALMLVFTVGVALGFFLAAALRLGVQDEVSPSEPEFGEALEDNLQHLH